VSDAKTIVFVHTDPRAVHRPVLPSFSKNISLFSSRPSTQLRSEDFSMHGAEAKGFEGRRILLYVEPQNPPADNARREKDRSCVG
jgi:hypothetical protein